MSAQRELDMGGRRLALEVVAQLDAAAYPSAAEDACSCRARGWVCRHLEAPEQCIDRIFDRREPGQEG